MFDDRKQPRKKRCKAGWILKEEEHKKKRETATEATVTVLIYSPPPHVASPFTLLTNAQVSHQPLVLKRNLLQKRWAPMITSTDSFLIILSNIRAGGWGSFLQALMDAVITSALPNRAAIARNTTGPDRQPCQKVTAEMWKFSITRFSPNP